MVVEVMRGMNRGKYVVLLHLSSVKVGNNIKNRV